MSSMIRSNYVSSPEATASAGALAIATLAGAVQTVHQAAEIPPITIWAYVIAAACGLAGGFAFRRLAPGITDQTDRMIALMMSSIFGGVLGPVTTLLLVYRYSWDWMLVLPTNGVIPVAFVIGAILPFSLGTFVVVVDSWKKSPGSFTDFIARFRRAMSGKE